MKIQEHLLQGDDVTIRKTPNHGGAIDPRYLVFHFTAGGSAAGAVAWLCNPEAKASAHLVLARDGSITQLAPFNIKTWHAGKSSWAGLTGMNQYSIGIEIDNAGELMKVGSEYISAFHARYPASEVVEVKATYWHAYTQIQIERATELAQLLVSTYGLKDVIGHEDIAPGRKNDPGPAFPLAYIRSKSLGRMEDDDLWQVTADGLNIRRGPGVEFEPAASPLALGTKVSLLEGRDRWSRVSVEGEGDVEGWVSNKFIKKID